MKEMKNHQTVRGRQSALSAHDASYVSSDRNQTANPSAPPAHQSAYKRRKLSAFTRLYAPKFIACGVAAGLILALFTGLIIIYADMMSGVTFADPQFSEAIMVKDLTDREWLGGMKEADKQELQDDFNDLQDLLDGTESEPEDSISTNDPKKTEQDKKLTQSTAEPQPKVKKIDGVENIVLFGVDSRANDFRGRADVIMIFSINRNKKQINIVSLMRAMYVNIGISNHQWGLLNAAYSYGGPGLAVRTIERNMGIPIKGYVTVNFNSFVKIVNAAGGVGITLTPAEARHLEMAPGYHLMNGSDALRYARIRKIDSDFQRNRRQRTVVNSIMSAMASNGANLYNVANVVLANTRTNLNLSQYLTPSYLSYQRRQLQLPAMSDTYRTFINGKEVWPFKMGNTHKKLISFLTGN